MVQQLELGYGAWAAVLQVVRFEEHVHSPPHEPGPRHQKYGEPFIRKGTLVLIPFVNLLKRFALRLQIHLRLAGLLGREHFTNLTNGILMMGLEHRILRNDKLQFGNGLIDWHAQQTLALELQHLVFVGSWEGVGVELAENTEHFFVVLLDEVGFGQLHCDLPGQGDRLTLVHLERGGVVRILQILFNELLHVHYKQYKNEVRLAVFGDRNCIRRLRKDGLNAEMEIN